MQQHTERLGTAPLGRLLIALSLPGVALTITTTLYNIVDTMWVGRLGHEAIAALTIIFPYQILFYAIGGGTGIGVAALVARRFGERKLDATNRVAGQIFFLSAFWGLLFLMTAVFFADSILPFIGATPDIIDYSRQYLVITSYGAPLVILASVMSSLIRGSGDAIKPMIIMVSGSIVNIILDPFMILGIGPFPEMGVSGAAWATFIAQSCAALFALYYFFARKTSFRIKVSHMIPNWPIIKEIYKVGAPTAIMQVTESGVFIVLNTIVSSYGSVPIATLGIILRISDFVFMPVMGVSHGLLPIVGFCFGEGNYKRLWRAVKLASVGLIVLLVFLTVIMEVFTPQIIGIFTKEPAMLATAITAMRISFVSIPLIGPTILFTTAFQGLSRGGTALILSFVKQGVIFVPLLYLCTYLWELTGVWISWPASDTLSLVAAFIFIWREYRIHKRKGFFEPVNGNTL